QARDFSCAAAKSRGRTPGTMHAGARILSVADAYDTLRCEQVFRRAKSHEEAMTILVENTGTQFDGTAINALTRWSDANGLGGSSEYLAEDQSADAADLFADAQEAHDAHVLSLILSHLYLLENLYDGFYIVDAELRFLVFNGAAARLLGQPAEQLLSRAWTSRTICYADADGRELLDDQLPLRRALESHQQAARSVRI